MTIGHQLGERVMLTRRRKGLTQQQLANAVAMHRNTIYQLEAGKVQTISAIRLGHLARVVGTSTDYLLGLTEDATTPARGVLPHTEHAP